VDDGLTEDGVLGPRRALLRGDLALEVRQRLRPEAPLSVVMSLACIRPKLKPEPINLGKKEAGVTFAVAVMWASTSRTVQSLHRDGVAHCCSLIGARSAASAARSARTTGQMSMPGT
jgi:hypothetical protein